jgi:hypothetical protein
VPVWAERILFLQRLATGSHVTTNKKILELMRGDDAMDEFIEDSVYGSGYLLVPRGLILGELAHCSPATRELYIWSLVKGNHTDARFGTKLLRKGQFASSVPQIREALHSRHGAGRKYYSTKQIETAKTNLKRMGLIKVDAIARGCLITVLNYCEIQAPSSYSRKRKSNEGRSKRQMTSNECNTVKDNSTPAPSLEAQESFEQRLLKARNLEALSDDRSAA